MLSFIKTTIMTMISIVSFILCSEMPNDMIYVEGGNYRMERLADRSGADTHVVEVIRLTSFLLGKYEVTVGEFRDFAREMGYITVAERDNGAGIFGSEGFGRIPDACWKTVNPGQTDLHPVVCLSWYDAIKFCNWRSRKEGFEPCYTEIGDTVICNFNATGYRLPTYAEWEYAARNPRGENVNTFTQIAARIRSYARSNTEEINGFAHTLPVGSFACNELGIFDMHSNVYEWCWDWNIDDYADVYAVDTNRRSDTDTLCTNSDLGYQCSAVQARQAIMDSDRIENITMFCGIRLVRSAALAPTDI